MADHITRPTPRELFLTKDRQIQIFFYTSNIPKYLQARIVFERSGLILHHFRNKTEPYEEHYEDGKQALLSRAIRQILGSVGSGSLFFVEDTSLRIEALSDNDADFPGLGVKEWFPNVSFEQLDEQLRALGNNRQAEIKSDIALHVPGLPRPVFFHGSTRGRVADSSPEFLENLQYPWLTPNTFNGWFIPQQSERRLGEMSLEESWKFDFRVRALESVIARLEEFTAILNLPAQAYIRRQSPNPLTQLPLFAGNVLIVIGHTCAGKTTFGNRAHDIHEMLHIEASAVLRMLRHDQDADGSGAFEFACKLLAEKGADIIARKILQVYSSDFQKGVVITGFRTIEELELIKSHFPQTRILFLDATERTRYQRHLERGRAPECKQIAEFRLIDEQQYSFGLLRVSEDLADIKLTNEGSIDQFHRQIDAVLTESVNVAGISNYSTPVQRTEVGQLLRCLDVLDRAGRPMSTDEIEAATTSVQTRIRHNNANKVLKSVPELAKRLEMAGTRVRYDLLNAGRAYLRFMQRYKGVR